MDIINSTHMVIVLITKSDIDTICSLYIKATKPGGKDNSFRENPAIGW